VLAVRIKDHEDPRSLPTAIVPLRGYQAEKVFAVCLWENQFPQNRFHAEIVP